MYSWASWQRRRVPAGRVPLTAWSAARRPAHYLGTVDLDGAIAQKWATDAGLVVVVWPLTGARRPGLATWARQAEGSGNWALVAVTGRFSVGPELDAILPGLPDRTYDPEWAQLAKAIGRPVPYWPSTLREAQLIREWQPGADTVTAMAVPALDTAALLRTAVTYEEGHPTNRVLVNLARQAHQQAAATAAHDLEILGKSFAEDDVTDTVLTVAARPLAVPEADLDDVDAVQRRAGWLELLARTDMAAARCVREVSLWDGGVDLPFGNPDHVTPAKSRWAREWAARLQPTPRTAAFELLDSERAGEALIDPATDTPVVREADGDLLMAVPQRLPAQAPLAELILDGPIWVRTADGVLYPAPRDAYYGISWGYGGSGPGTLALLIAALLDDITAKAPADINGAPRGLQELTKRKMPKGTVLTRKQLEAARRGDPPILAVPDDEDDDE